MDDPWISPGQAAHEAFTTGVEAAALLALFGVVVLYWGGLITSPRTILLLILALPIYFLLVAILLSKWLGLDPGLADLEPVSPER